MQKHIAEAIESAADDLNIDVHIREYSGRFMFGEETYAVVGSYKDFTQAVAWAAVRMSGGEDRKLDFILEVGKSSVDSLGRSTVWY